MKLAGSVGFALAAFIFISTYGFAINTLQTNTSEAVALGEMGKIFGTEAGAQQGDAIVPPKIEPPKLPVLISTSTPPADLSAEAYIVKDAETGMLLAGKEEYKQWPIASITKLMSALVLLEHDIDWATTTTVVADELIDTHMYAGDTYTLEELWQAGLVASSNKAIMSLVDATNWEREAFVARMNQKAGELGMTDTVFVEPTGLNDGNVSTASDIALLLEEALRQEKIQQTLVQPELEIYSREREKAHHMWNTNWLLLGWIPNTFETIYGGKTGYITASGYNFSMQASDDQGHDVFVVVLGADVHEARFTEARDVALWAYEAYEWPDSLDHAMPDSTEALEHSTP